MKRLYVLFLSLSLLSIAGQLFAMETKSDQQLNEKERKLELLDLPEELLVKILDEVFNESFKENGLRTAGKNIGSLPIVCSTFNRIINDEQVTKFERIIEANKTLTQALSFYGLKFKIDLLASTGTKKAKELLKEIFKTKEGKSIGEKELHTSIMTSPYHPLERLKCLLKTGINPDALIDKENNINSFNPFFMPLMPLPKFKSRSPLTLATINKRIESAGLLFEYGADVNMESFGETPLTIAVEKNLIDLVKLYAPKATMENLCNAENVWIDNCNTINKEIADILVDELRKRRNKQNNNNNNQN